MYLTLEKAHELVDAAVALKGADYVYPKAGVSSCTYVDVSGGKYDYDTDSYEERKYDLGCIVGTALVNGLDLNMEDIAASSINDAGADNFLDWLEDSGQIEGFDQDALEFLTKAQINQDYKKSWGEAVEKAKAGLHWRAFNSEYSSNSALG